MPIISVDFKQLEMVTFAYYTQDKNLITDIKNKVDLHSITARDIFNVSLDEVTPEQRQIGKGGNFLMIYGGGVKRAMQQLEIDEDAAKRLLQSFYERYPQTKAWQTDILAKVEATKVPTKNLTKKGKTVYEGYYITPTRRLLKFYTRDALEWQIEKGIMTSFNPPDIKDYPVQSLGTADIVLIFVGKLFRRLMGYREKCLLINTIHDDVMIDCSKNNVDFTCNLVKDEVQLIPEWLKSDFNIDFNLPLDVDIKVGLSWGDL